MSKTLGYRNNNPLNIRFSPMNKWLGQTGSYKGFCVFDTMEHGFRAALILLCNYQRKGYDTISKIVEHWAPSTENDTAAYIRFCCHSLQCVATDGSFVDHDPNSRITTIDELLELACAMCQVEIGCSPFPWGTAHERHVLSVSFWKAAENYKYPALCV